MNNRSVFNHSDWDSTANGRWEAAARPHTVNGRPPFEAVCRISAAGAWGWVVYEPVDDDPEATLDPLATGQAATLVEAQRQADHHARQWRDLGPTNPSPAEEWSP